ncbi:MAG: DNA polymerase III subunit delta [Methyloceanibacter sp.]|jgi:DNA polymerase-3 subunit delta
MVAYKAAAVPAFLRAPDPSCRAMLVYGPDAGLVSERAATLAQVFAESLGQDTEVVRLDDRDFAEDPGRIAVECRTPSMFSSSKIVRAKAGVRLDVGTLKALFEEPADNPLIVEAGNLRPESALRKLFEKHGEAAALPCYAAERDLSDLIDAELAKSNLSIDRETKAYLMGRLGADQALSRGEVAKLALFAQGSSEVTHDDVAAIVGDAAEIALDNFVYAVSAGDAAGALRELNRLAASGTDRTVALGSLSRHFTRLYVVATHPGTLEDGAKKLRPPLHYKRRDMFLSHCRKWGTRRLASALPLIQEAVRRTRRSPDLASAFSERLLLALASKV